MKQIYRTMGGILLPGIVLGALLAIIAGTALLPRLGRQMDIVSADYKGYEDARETKIICERKMPKIIRRDSRVWRTGEDIRISQVFEGVDAEGNETEIQVLDIQDENGNSRMDNYQRAEHKAVFSECGIYLIKLQTMDEQRKTVIKKFVLLVDSRQGGI